jgi:serine/threonine protein kinase
MLFAASGVVKVTDFGIAKVIGGPETVVTRDGDVLGTPAYIAPEQVRGGQLSPATDVYGLATVLYELMAGVLPFPEEAEQVAILFKHAYETPVSLRDAAPDVPEPVAAVVMRGLATEPAQRFASAEAFGVALAEASTQAWGTGWLPSDVLPLMDAGPIRSATGPPSAPHGRALPTAPPAQARETAAASTAGAARKPIDPARRRRLIISWVIVAVLVIAAILIFVVVKPLHIYG